MQVTLDSLAKAHACALELYNAMRFAAKYQRDYHQRGPTLSTRIPLIVLRKAGFRGFKPWMGEHGYIFYEEIVECYDFALFEYNRQRVALGAKPVDAPT